MDCYHHPGVQAAAVCSACGRPICSACTYDVGGRSVCQQCLALHHSSSVQPQAVGSTNALALTSLVLGVVGLVSCSLCGAFGPLVMGLPAAVTGFIARRQLAEAGDSTQSNRTMANIGLWAGLVELVLGLLFLIFMGGLIGLGALSEILQSR